MSSHFSNFHDSVNLLHEGDEASSIHSAIFDADDGHQVSDADITWAQAEWRRQAEAARSARS